MNKMIRQVKYNRSKAVTNFMNGISYTLTPLLTLKIVTASSIFGEPQYYRNGEFAPTAVMDGHFLPSTYLKDHVLPHVFASKTTSEIMEQIIDDSLSYDFYHTLQWAVTLRKEYYMRLNPQIIMVRAAIHPNRTDYTKQYPGMFSAINQLVMQRADEPTSQLTYWLYRFHTKNHLPSILKRSWSDRLSNASEYELYKYKKKGIGLIDTVRICHANSPSIDLLMQDKLTVKSNETTWETLRSQNLSWSDILTRISIGHMALLRNLRGIFTEIEDITLCNTILEKLKAGVKSGKQFPFRYYSAIKAIYASSVHHKSILLDALEECIDLSMENLPYLKGRTMCLSDNSGSAWGTFQSEYGSVTVAEIGNLSSVITASHSDEGYVGMFGDGLSCCPVLKRNGILSAASDLSKKRGNDVGRNTENGIWIFFREAIEKKEHWDHIFIYSDQQAGHGGLYGLNPKEYAKYSTVNHYNIDVCKLIEKYRKQVNPRVNVFTIQTAGYNNVLIPENTYRTSILYGWTGKELLYASMLNQIWDEAEQN